MSHYFGTDSTCIRLFLSRSFHLPILFGIGNFKNNNFFFTNWIKFIECFKSIYGPVMTLWHDLTNGVVSAWLAKASVYLLVTLVAMKARCTNAFVWLAAADACFSCRTARVVCTCVPVAGAAFIFRTLIRFAFKFRRNVFTHSYEQNWIMYSILEHSKK